MGVCGPPDALGKQAAERARQLRAFGEEFDRIIRTLQRLGVSRVDAEDLAQEVFVVMCRRWHDYDPERPLGSWLAGIAFKVAQAHHRRRGREVPGDEASLARAVDGRPVGEEQLAGTRARDLLMRGLDRLPEHHRSLLVMHDLDQVPMRDIAAAMSVPLFTAYTRLRTARQALAKAMRRLGVMCGLVPVGVSSRDPSPLAPTTEESTRALPPAAASGTPSAARWLLPASLGAALVAVLVLAVGDSSARRQTPPTTSTTMPAALAPAAGIRIIAPGAVFSLRPAVEADPSISAMAAALGRGLVGYWGFDDGPGSRIARDGSGQGNDCLLRQLDARAAWVAGALGGALAFDGRGWLECPRAEALARLGGELSIALWIRRGTAPRAGIHALVSRQLGSANKDHFFLGFDGTFLEFSSHLLRGFLSRPLPQAPEQWMHLAAVRAAGSTTTMFVDGVEVGRRRSWGDGYGGGATPLTIGGALNGAGPEASELFEGVLDELVIYGRALSDEEIGALAGRRQPERW